MGPALEGIDRKLLSFLQNFSYSLQGVGDSGEVWRTTHILTNSSRCIFQKLGQTPCESIKILWGKNYTLNEETNGLK